MNTKKPRHVGRKLLGATIGLATLSLVGTTACTCGNLIAPPPRDAGPPDAPTTPDAPATNDARK